MTDYTIANESEFNTLCTTSLSSGDTVKLTANITFTSARGSASSNRINMVDGVTFDGQGYKLTLTSGDHYGLFDLPSTSAPDLFIQNLEVDGTSATLFNNRGFLLNTSPSGINGTIKNCYAHGSLPADTGGIAGRVYSATNLNFERCYFSGSITNFYAGGIIGFLSTISGTINITECYSLCSISGGTYSAGIVGTIWAGTGTVNITNCYHSGSITAGGNRAGIVAYYQPGSTILNINNCYCTEGDLVTLSSNSNREEINLTNCVAASLTNNDYTLFNTNTNNSEDLTEIQGQLTGAASGWADTADTWTAGSASNYPTLDQFKLGPWENYDIYTDGATLQDGYTDGASRATGSSGSGDPHITTITGQTYNLRIKPKCNFLMFDNNDENERLIINANIRKGSYPLWRSKEYINAISIIYIDDNNKKNICVISTGFRGTYARVTKKVGNFDVSEKKLAMRNGKLFCSNCKFRTRRESEMCLHLYKNTHMLIPNIRNKISVKIETYENIYTIKVENINEDGFKPCNVVIEMKNKCNLNKYSGAIIKKGLWQVKEFY